MGWRSIGSRGRGRPSPDEKNLSWKVLLRHFLDWNGYKQKIKKRDGVLYNWKFYRNVWTFARHCPASRWPSPLPCPLGTASPSTWTPVGREQLLPKQRRRRRKLHLLWEGMQEEEPSLWRTKLKPQLLMPCKVNTFLLKKQLKRLRKLSSVTNAKILSNLKMAWRSTLVNPTKKWPHSHQHLNGWGSSRKAQWISLPPPSWTPAGRSSTSIMTPWKRRKIHHHLFDPCLHLLHLTSALPSTRVAGESANWEGRERGQKKLFTKHVQTVM